MTSIMEKRVSLHKQLSGEQQQNKALKSEIAQLHAIANIGTATCMIAHEINNLLTPLGTLAAVALKNPDDKPLAKKALENVVQSCARASEIMESMLAVVTGEGQEKKNCPLNTLTREIFTCLCRDFAKDSITVEISIPDDLTVWAVPVQIQQVLMNLILNARDAMLPRGGILTIKAQDYGDVAQIELADTGCGIEPEDLENIFEPFFTTKSDKKTEPECSGCGLGLGFCKRIVEEHGGCIWVESKPAEGTTFKITFPKSQQGNS